MREDNIFRSLSWALIVLTVVFVPVYFLAGFAFARMTLFYGLGCTALGIVSAWLMGKRHFTLQILAAAIPSALLSLLLPVNLPNAQIIRYILMGSGALLAVYAERLCVTSSGKALKPGLLLTPIALQLVVSTFIWLVNADKSSGIPDVSGLFLLLCSLWFAIILFLLNRLSLRQAAHVGAHNDVSAGVRRGGSAGVILFIGCSFLLASIGAVVRAIGEFFRLLGSWILAAMLFLSSLFPSGGDQRPAGTPPPEELPPVGGGAESPFMQILSIIITIAVLLAVLAAICYGLYKLFPKLWKKLQEKLRNLFASWKADEADYRDRTESLMTIKQALADAGAGLRKFARRFRRRLRLSDFDTNTGKIRFLFREYLHGLTAAGHEPPPGATANDIARPAPPLASAYNRARYGEEEPSDREIEKAKDSSGV